MAGIAGLGMIAGASFASAQSNCDWYAHTALKQQQENERLKCGFKGEAWHTDLKAHSAWCTTVGPDVWKAQAQKRDQALVACSKK
jgi:hypothetical protein